MSSGTCARPVRRALFTTTTGTLPHASTPRQSLRPTSPRPPSARAAAAQRSPGHPAVVGVDVAAARVVPHADLAGRVGRRALQPAPIEVDDVAALAGVVLQLAPGQRVILVADPEETAKAEDGVFGPARYF